MQVHMGWNNVWLSWHKIIVPMLLLLQENIKLASCTSYRKLETGKKAKTLGFAWWWEHHKPASLRDLYCCRCSHLCIPKSHATQQVTYIIQRGAVVFGRGMAGVCQGHPTAAHHILLAVTRYPDLHAMQARAQGNKAILVAGVMGKA
jgi:hypothetical protein